MKGFLFVGLFPWWVPSYIFSVFFLIRSCQLQIGTCRGCLPSISTRIKSCIPAAADLQHPLKEFRVESRNKALCVQEKTGRTGLYIVRYSQGLILWAQFLYLLLYRKALKSGWWQFLMTNRSPLNPPTLSLWSSFSELSEVLSPRLQSSYCPK